MKQRPSPVLTKLLSEHVDTSLIARLDMQDLLRIKGLRARSGAVGQQSAPRPAGEGHGPAADGSGSLEAVVVCHAATTPLHETTRGEHGPGGSDTSPRTKASMLRGGWCDWQITPSKLSSSSSSSRSHQRRPQLRPARSSLHGRGSTRGSHRCCRP